MMKSFNRLILFALIPALASFLLPIHRAAAESLRGVELVMAVENGVFINENDPDNERFEAVSILADLMDPTDLIGVISFNREAEVLRELSWKGTGGESDDFKAKFKEHEQQVRTVDLEKALQEAFRLFRTEGDAQDAPKRALVLIFSGRVNVGNADENEQSRNRIISDILPKFRKSGIPIYSVGVGAKQDSELTASLGSLSAGFHFPLSDPGDLPNTAIDIFNDIKQMDIAPLEGLSFKTGEYVDEALIVADGVSKDEKCGLMNPQRELFRKGKNTDNISWSMHKNFTIVRLTNPQPGRWTLHGRTTQSCTVFLDSSRRIKFRMPRRLMFHDESLLVASYLDQGGRMVQNPQVLERTVFKAALENGERIESNAIELNSSEPGIYTGMLPLEAFRGTTRLNLYALSTDITNKSYTLINVSEESWLQVISPPAELPAGSLPDIEVHVLSELDELGRYEMAVQLDLQGVGSWSAQLKRVKDTRIFKGRIEADLDPGDYSLTFMLRRFDSPVAEEMQVKNTPLHITGMIEQVKVKDSGWVLITGGIVLLVAFGVGGFFLFKRRRRLAALIKEEIPMTFFPKKKEEEEKEEGESAAGEAPGDELRSGGEKAPAETSQNASIFEEPPDAVKRVDPLEQLTRNIKVDEEQPKEPKLAIESQGLTDVIDQVVQNVEGRVEGGPKVKKKVTGNYQEDEEVLMVKSGGNVNLKVPAGQGIDKLAESLDSVEELAEKKQQRELAPAAAVPPAEGETDDIMKVLSHAVEIPQSDEPVMLSGGLETETVNVVSGGAGGEEKEIISASNPPDMRFNVNTQRENSGEKPAQKKSRVPSPPQVSKNELDALLNQARLSLDKNNLTRTDDKTINRK